MYGGQCRAAVHEELHGNKQQVVWHLASSFLYWWVNLFTWMSLSKSTCSRDFHHLSLIYSFITHLELTVDCQYWLVPTELPLCTFRPVLHLLHYQHLLAFSHYISVLVLSCRLLSPSLCVFSVPGLEPCSTCNCRGHRGWSGRNAFELLKHCTGKEFAVNCCQCQQRRSMDIKLH